VGQNQLKHLQQRLLAEGILQADALGIAAFKAGAKYPQVVPRASIPFVKAVPISGAMAASLL